MPGIGRNPFNVTGVASSGIDLKKESKYAPARAFRFQPVQRARGEANDVATKPPAHQKLNAVGVRNLHMMHVLERIASVFNEENVPVLVLKGAALHLLLYSELNERPMEDLDILVHPTDLERAGKRLETLGAASGEPLVREDFCPRFHYEVEFSLGRIYPVKVDLHVRPFRPLRYSRLVPPDALWTRAQRVRVGQATIQVPSIEDMLIHLTAHAAIHGCSQKKWKRDIELWVEAFQNEINWDQLIETAREWRLSLPVREGFCAVAPKVDAGFAGHAIARLSSMRVTWCDRLALWQSPRDADHPVAHVLVNVLCTPGWRFVMAYLLAVAVPGRRHMRDWYRRRHWGWFPCAQLLRWLRPGLCCIPILRRWFENALSESSARPGEAA